MSTQRILLLSFLVLTALVAVTLENLLGGLSSLPYCDFLRQTLFGLEGWTFATVLGYALAASAAIYCWRAPTIKEPATQVVEEMTRVTWPTGAETRAATYAVVIATLVCAALLGAFDYGWGTLTESVYSPR